MILRRKECRKQSLDMRPQDAAIEATKLALDTIDGGSVLQSRSIKVLAQDQGPGRTGGHAGGRGGLDVKRSTVRVSAGRKKAAKMAGREIDRLGDQTASAKERAHRKGQLIKGPREFRDMRRDLPKTKSWGANSPRNKLTSRKNRPGRER